MELLKLAVKVCNTGTAIDHCESKLVESFCSILTLNGDKMSLGECCDHFQERVKFAEPLGVNLCAQKLIDMVKEEGEATHPKEIKGPGEKPIVNPECESHMDNVACHANQRVHALTFIRQAGERFEEVCRELKNDCMKGTDHFPLTVDDANSLLETCQNSDKCVQAQVKKSARRAVSFQQQDFPWVRWLLTHQTMGSNLDHDNEERRPVPVMDVDGWVIHPKGAHTPQRKTEHRLIRTIERKKTQPQNSQANNHWKPRQVEWSL